MASSVDPVGVKVPVQVIWSPLVMVATLPVPQVMSSPLAKPATASEKTRVNVVVWPDAMVVSLCVKEETVFAAVSSVYA